ncbi:MAG: hypothetical protein PHR77_02050 [Kiritimatiellae bacterium]|nr:hypothetical protein [Kiritimatiellia bacterium]MDD5521861.1 hypothetical protein [Kiritimatiellia bacterium]
MVTEWKESNLRVAVCVLVVSLFFCLPAVSKQDKPSTAKKPQVRSSELQIDEAISSGVDYIKKKQKKYGGWTIVEPKKELGVGSVQRQHTTRYEPGVTAFAVYTLLKSECPLDDLSVVPGINYLLSIGIFTNTPHSVAADLTTYDVAMISVALSYAIEKVSENKATPSLVDLSACRRQVVQAVQWLVKAQHHDDQKRNRKKSGDEIQLVSSEERGFELSILRDANSGAWGYKMDGSGPYDNSNTQFALLGLRAAQNIKNDQTCTDVDIPRDVWQRALAHLVSSQINGGWGYRNEPSVVETMTVAGIGGMIICISSLADNPPTSRIMKTSEIAQALALVEQMYPKQTANRFLDGYMLFSLERTCMLGGITTIGSHDWYRDGVAMLLRRRNSDGYFCGRGSCSDNTVQTCFALLFLKKVYVPIR